MMHLRHSLTDRHCWASRADLVPICHPSLMRFDLARTLARAHDTDANIAGSHEETSLITRVHMVYTSVGLVRLDYSTWETIRCKPSKDCIQD